MAYTIRELANSCRNSSEGFPPGGRLGLKHARICVSKSEGNRSFFGIKLGNEMNEKFSFKMGMRFAASLDMGENFLNILYEAMYKNAGTELQSI